MRQKIAILAIIISVAVTILSACSGENSTPESVESDKPIVPVPASVLPHPVEKFYDCLKCHNPGREEAAPDDHLGYKNDDCQVCHSTE
jgi:hypothetical protein